MTGYDEYEEFKKALERAETLDVLLELETQVMESELEEKTKAWFKSMIGRKKKDLAKAREVYEAEVRSMVDKLPVDRILKRVLLDYWISHARVKKWAINSMRKYKVPYVRDLIYWIYEYKKGGEIPVEVEDFDKTNLKAPELESFLVSRFESPSTRYLAWIHIKAFLNYLVYGDYINVFAVPVVEKPRRTRAITGEFTVEGIPRKKYELDTIMTLLRSPTPGLAPAKTKMYELFGRFLLQSGLRYGHLLGVLKVDDLYEAWEIREVQSVITNKIFYRIPYAAILEKWKEERGESVEKKGVPTFVYISESLYNDLRKWIEMQNMDYNDKVFDESTRNVQRRANTISKTAGIKDFTFYDFRATFASALFNAMGRYEKVKEIVRRRGGWERESIIPFGHYVDIMTEREGLEIALEYEIYLDNEAETYVRGVMEEEKVEVTPSDYRRVLERLEELEREREEDRKLIRELYEKLRGR